MASGYYPANNKVNLRIPHEVQPGEFQGFVDLIKAVAERQDKPPPQPERRRA